MHHLVLEARFGTHGRRSRRVDDTFEEFLDHLPSRVAHVVVHLGKLRNNIRRVTAVGYHVVHTAIRRHVLTHHVDHVVHHFDAVESRTTAVGCGRRVRCDAMKTETSGFVRRGARRRRMVAICRVPVQHDVDIVKQTFAGHVDLTGSAFFGRCAIYPNRAFGIRLFEPRGDGRTRCGRSGTE